MSDRNSSNSRFIEVMDDIRERADYAIKVSLQAKNDLANCYETLDRLDRDFSGTIKELERLCQESRCTISYLRDSYNEFRLRLKNLELKAHKLYCQDVHHETGKKDS